MNEAELTKIAEEMLKKSSPELAIVENKLRRDVNAQLFRMAFLKYIARISSRMPLLSVKGDAGPVGPLHRMLAMGLFANVACGLSDGIIEYTQGGEKEKIRGDFAMCVERVEARGPHPRAFATNDLARAVASAIVAKLRSPRLSQTGRVIFVYGYRGSGKTTLVYWSLYSVLWLLGYRHREIERTIRSLWVTSLDEYLAVQKVATKLAEEGLALPFVVVEDAGVILSKYLAVPYISGKLVKAVYELQRSEQISREGACSVIYLAHPESVLKGIRTVADLRVVGYFEDYPPYRYTVWLAVKGHLKSRHAHDVFATVHPVLRVPDHLFTEWTKKKLETRTKLIEAVERMIGEAEELKEAEGEEHSEVDNDNALEDPG
ncbi:MAG: hypothetical protein QXZ31_03785 [Thermofilaceae archaeon]